MLMLVFLIAAPLCVVGQGTTNVGVYKWSLSNANRNTNFGDGNMKKASSSSSGKKVVVVCDNKGIIVSSDYGATFAQSAYDADLQAWSPEWESVASSDDGQVLLASGGGWTMGLAKSADGGATWAQTYSGQKAGGYDNVAVSGSGTSLMAFSDAFYASSNSGTSWSPTAFASGAGSNSIAFGVTDQQMFVCTTSGVFFSGDAGVSVYSIYSERCDNMAVSRNGNHIVINSGGPVVTSHDGGKNWVTKSFLEVTGVTTNSNNGWKDLAISDDGQTICAANEWKGVFISTDGGLTKYNKAPLSDSVHTPTTSSGEPRWRICTLSGDGETIVVGTAGTIKIGRLVSSLNPTSPSPSKSTSTGSGTGSGTSSSGTTPSSAGTGTSGTCTASDCGKCSCDCQGINGGVQTSKSFQSTENFCDAEGCTQRLGEDACPSTNSQISAMWIKDDVPKASLATSVNSQMCAAMTIGLCAATAIINGGM